MINGLLKQKENPCLSPSEQNNAKFGCLDNNANKNIFKVISLKKP